MNRKRLHEQKTMSSLGSGWSRNSLHPLPYFLTQVVFHGFQGIFFQAADLGLADMDFISSRTEGFEILEYKLLPDDAANAMSIVAAADYSLTFRPGYEPENESPQEWFEKLVQFFDTDHVMIMKKTKKGEREMDLKPFVYELKVRKEGEIPALFMKVSAGSAANIKPELCFGLRIMLL